MTDEMFWSGVIESNPVTQPNLVTSAALKITMDQPAKLEPCPCCRSLVIGVPGSYEICAVCGWEDDPIQSRDQSYAGGANMLSLGEARAKWAKD
jgi:hypothetical protein